MTFYHEGGTPALHQQINDLFLKGKLVEVGPSTLRVDDNVTIPNKSEVDTFLAEVEPQNYLYTPGKIKKISSVGNLLKQEIDTIKAKNNITNAIPGNTYLTSPCKLAEKGTRFIIHAVMPQTQNRDQLREAVGNALKHIIPYYNKCVKPAGQGLKSIALPALAIHYGFDLQSSADIIISVVAGYIQLHGGGTLPIEEFRFIVANEREFDAYQRALEQYARAKQFRQTNKNPIVYQDIEEEEDIDKDSIFRADFGSSKIMPKIKRIIVRTLDKPSVVEAPRKVAFASQARAILPSNLDRSNNTYQTVVKPYDGPSQARSQSTANADGTAAQKSSNSPSSWSAWFNRNFNAICLTGTAAILTLYKLFS